VNHCEILVRSHAQGSDLKRALAKLKIGSVELLQESIFASVDAGEVERVLMAINEPSRTAFLHGALATETSFASVRQDSIAIAQQYQFFRNQWFHPRLGVGVDLARETTTEQYQPVFVFDNAARTSREITPARVEAPEHRFIARPFVETGLKAYMTRRTFFTADTRLMFRSGIDEVLFRLGFGVDF